MRKFEFLTLLVKPVATVFFTVAICVAVLFAVQPWQAQTRDELGSSYLSANVGTANILASTPEQTTKSKPKAVLASAPKSVPKAKPVSALKAEPASAPKTAPKPASSSPSQPVTTASVQKPEAVKVPPPPERLSAGVSEEEEEKDAAEDENADDEKAVEEEEQPEAELTESEEDPNVPTLPVRAPHHKQRLLKEKEKRAEEFAAPWNKAESDKALQPLLSYEISAADIEALKKFVDLAYKEKFSKAREYRDKLKNPVARKFARWYYYRKKAPDTEAKEIIEFIDQNPLWPGREDVEAAAEDALFWREESADRIISYFAGREPVSGTGLAALGTALIEKGRKEEGIKRIKQAWRLHVLTPAIEKKIRKLKVLEAEDHYARAGFLLMQDKKHYVSAVKRILPLVGKERQEAVKAHIATVKRAGNAGTLLTYLDPKLKEEPAILFARIQWLRRADNNEKARALLKTAPKSAEALIDPEKWWDERQVQIRSALNEDDAALAYELASGPNDGLEHWDLSEVEFLAGWIAFRFLNKPEVARKHLLAAAAAGGLPKRRSRAAYWLGRIETAAGNQNEARARYMEAAQHHHTFYGQLAHQMAAGPDALLTFRPYTRPTKQDIDQFVAQDVMQAMVLAEKADFENLLSLFMFDLARNIESAPQMILLCELASRIAPPHHTVRMAKIALNRDFPVEHYAYPRALPEFSAITDGQDVDTALIHALTRQESEFNPGIVSSAGAVGLMQLLPSTAKLVARRHNVDYVKYKLSADPAYNVSLGSAFLHQLISNYDGSYIMALAGYNAGPGRVNRWAKELGDPRDSNVDPIDWIERIPFTETRDYVQKILESVQVYRTRLLNESAPIRLAEDLHRGRKDKPKFMAVKAAN